MKSQSSRRNNYGVKSFEDRYTRILKAASEEYAAALHDALIRCTRTLDDGSTYLDVDAFSTECTRIREEIDALGGASVEAFASDSFDKTAANADAKAKEGMIL